MNRRHCARIVSASLLGSTSLVTLASAAQAHDVIFSSAPQIPAGPIDTGREIVLSGGTVQVRLTGGAIASFVDTAQFSIRPDGGIDLRSGSVIVVATDGAQTLVQMPQGVRGSISSGSTGTFTATASGSRGSATMGSVSITANGVTKSFNAGQFWIADTGRSPDRVIAGVAAAVPGADSNVRVRPLREGGIVAAAENGIPVALGEALAAIGAKGDVVAAARRVEAYNQNPTITALPTGDYALLVAYAGGAGGVLGEGATFNGASADIIRTYFQYLAGGHPGANFRTAYAAILINYLDLLRSGVLPSTFQGATQAQLNAYLAYIGRTDGFGSLTPANRQLFDAYLAFLSGGGNADAFGTSVTSLTAAFLNYIRGGGDPAAFTQASASVVAQYLAIVQSGGLKTNLTAQNQALLTAYLASNGVGFVQTDATSLAAFVAYLNAGGLPSAYGVLPPETIRAYLDTLDNAGLFDSLLGTQAEFLRNYLTFLRSGGTPDQFNALPINLARVNATALSLYVDYLLGGGIPSAYGTLTQAQIRAYLDQLTATGQFDALLGTDGAFLSEYYAYIKTGADADSFAGLPTVDVNAYATALTAFAAYLRAGNLPSGYTTLTEQQIRSYLAALQVSGKLGLLGDSSMLLGDYLTYLRAGGAPDSYVGLPLVTYQSYAAALATYFAYLNGGGLPSNYAALTPAQLRQYLDVLKANGVFTLLGSNARFYTDYLTYLAGGGTADAFTGLPIVTFQGYATALSAYFAYLNAGGLPSGYSALTQAQVRQYLDALNGSGQLAALLGANATFYSSYLAYLAGGGSPDAFTGLPIVAYQGYATALAAYYAFLIQGGSPSAYTALTQAQVRQYLDALDASGQLTTLLGVNAAFFTNYLSYVANGGDANAYPGLPSSTYGQYAVALSAYFAYLTTGGLPSGYTALTQVQIREYLDVLNANSQLAALLGANATFFTNYLAYLAGGGTADTFTGLPIVAYQSYATALSAYYAYLTGGGLPANYTQLTAAQVRQYLDALSASGQLAALLGTNAGFFSDYLAYLAGGGTATDYPGLPANTYAAYGTSLQAFVSFLRGDGLPGGYSALTSQQIRDYLAVLTANGQAGRIGNSADIVLLTAYVEYLASGGVPNQFQGLPAFVTYEAGLRAFYAYILGGGKPSTYTLLTSTQIVAYIQALDAAGLVAAKLSADQATFLRDYAVYVAGGNNPDQFAGLPGNQSLQIPVVTQGLASAPRSNDNNLGLASAGKGLKTSASTSGSVVLTGDTVTAFSGAGGATNQGAQTVDARTVDNTIAIARLTAGKYNADASVTVSQNEGAHIVWGTPATAIPASGLVNYGLVTATQPTVEGGTVAPGTFDANLTIDLASRMVGWDSVIDIGGTSYRFASAGGTAAPSVFIPANSASFIGAASTANNGLAGTGAGFLSGVGGIYTGFSYTATAPIGAVTGAAIFGAGQPISTLPTPTYTPTSTTTGDLTAPTYAYASGLATNNVAVRSTYPTTTASGLTIQNGAAITIDTAGGLLTSSNASTQDLSKGTAQIKNIFGDNLAVIGRWTNGTYRRGPSNNAFDTLSATQSLHYVELAPSGFTVPTTGQINYVLLAATQPTYNNGATGAGLFDGKMALAFGSSVKVALEGTIRMPEPAGTVTYAFSTPGGVAEVGNLDGQTFSNNVIAVTAPLTGSGLACTTSCRINLTGGFGGAEAARIGAVYFTSDSRFDAPSIEGAAIFAGTAAPAATTNVSDHLFFSTTGTSESLSPGTGGSYDINAQSQVVALYNFDGLYDKLGTAKIAESGATANGAVSWTRWTDGVLETKRNGPGGVTLNANQGYQIVTGVKPTGLPSTGTVNFMLTGGTKPTEVTGTLAAGSLKSANAAVLFGNSAGIKVGFDIVANIGGNDYNIFTTGKIADLLSSELTLSSDYFFRAIGPGGTATGGDCTATSCRAIFSGFLAGAGGSALGVDYRLQNTATQFDFNGVAAFTAAASGGGDTGGSGTGATGTAGTLSNQTAYAFGVGELLEHVDNSTVTYDADSVKNYSSSKGTRSGLVQEGGRLADVVGWSRWTGDTAGPLTNQGANKGVHILAGTPTSNTSTLPTGTVQYTLAGATKPTLASGSAAPGTLTGTLAVQFGALPRVGFDLTATVGQYGWNIQTTGGSQNPSQSQVPYGSDLTFRSVLQKGAGVTGLNAASCTGTCSANVNGQFFGTGVPDVGLGFSVYDGSETATGVAVFAKTP